MSPLPVVLTRAQVREADLRAARDLGIPPACLMENAGRGLASVTMAEIRRYGASGCAVVGARGNNGGDGFVAARHLHLRGIPVEVLLASPEASIAPDSDPRRNLEALRALGVPLRDASSPEALSRAAAALAPGRVIVDAVLGTGLEGPVRGHLALVLAWIGGTGRPVVAADLPSGLDADTGDALGPVPRCVATATFLALKPGLLRGRGPELAGRVALCDIGVPVGAVTGASGGGAPRAGSPPASPP